MGLGKTITSLAIMANYEDEWPLLILCPASLRYTWPEEIEKFFPSLPPQSIYVAKGFQDVGFTKRKDVKVLILTYSLFQERSAVQQALKSMEWKCIIADESHNLKSRSSQRSKLILPLLLQARRLVLLSGTPALARPAELWTQLSVLAPKLFGTWTVYANRYCNPHRKSFGQGRFVMDYSGSSNETELHAKLKHIMVRRLKCDVLHELPPKQRSIVPVSISAREDLVNCKRIMTELSQKRISMEDMAVDDARQADFEARSMLTQAYQATGIGKANAVSDYLLDWIAGSGDSQKILVFAHHKEVLDRIDKALLSKCPNTHIRIDGSVPSQIRAQLVRKFQTCSRVRVAILSVTAAGVGLTLTAASTVLFAELHWTPGVLVQAEDRAHRIGQKHNSVQIIYMVCKDSQASVDMTLWKMLGRKIHTLDQVVDGKEVCFSACSCLNIRCMNLSQPTFSLILMLIHLFRLNQEAPYLFNAQEDPSKSNLPVLADRRSAQDELSEFFSETSRSEKKQKSQKPVAGTLESFFRKAAGVPQKSKPNSGTKSSLHQLTGKRNAQNAATTSKKAEEISCDVCTFLNPVSQSRKTDWFPCGACGNLIKNKIVSSANKKHCAKPASTPLETAALMNQQNLISWACQACTLSNSKARSMTGWYTCDACDQPYILSETTAESSEDEDEDAGFDALISTPSLNSIKKPPASKTVTMSSGKASFRSAARISMSPEDNEVVVVDCMETSISRSKSQTCPPASFAKKRASVASDVIVVDDDDDSVQTANDDDVVEILETKPKAIPAAPEHVLEFSVSKHSGRVTVHFAKSGASSLVNFAVEDVVTSKTADHLLDARIKKASVESQRFSIDFDRQCIWRVLSQVESCGMDLSRHSMEQDVKTFITNYLELRPVEQKTLQDSGKSFAGAGLSRSIGKLMISSLRGSVERYKGGAKELARVNVSNGIASAHDMSVLDGKCCAWCGKTLSAASIRGEATYCSQECAEEGRLRRGGKFASANIRAAVFAMENGKCTLCGLDAHALFLQIRSLQPSERLNKLLSVNWTLPKTGKALDNLLQDPKEGNFWQVDHIKAVAEGGGSCGMENLRTLCVPCHSKETNNLRGRLKLHGPYTADEKSNGGNGSQMDIRTAFRSASGRFRK